MADLAPFDCVTAALRISRSQPQLCILRLHRTEPPCVSALGTRFACTWPTVPNSTSADGLILWLSPTEWAMVDQSADRVRTQLAEACEGVLHDVADMTGALAKYTVSGREARGFLSKSCSLDLHPRAFGEARCARTLFAQVTALIVRVGPAASDAFDVYVESSLSRYLEAWMRDAAAEYLPSAS